MRRRILFVVLAFSVVQAHADGLIPMDLEDVLPRVDAVVVAQVVSFSETITEDVKGKSVGYTYRIKARIIARVKGEVPKDELELKFNVVIVKGVWLGWPGSGLEMQLKPEEKYVFLLESRNERLHLLRAEAATALQSVKDLLDGKSGRGPTNKPDAEDGK